jgi:cysteine synthase A
MVDWLARRKMASSILDTAGLTPLVKLNRVAAGMQPTIACKVEYFGPSGSVKDRILPYMVAQAEKRGELKPGMTIIEATTGNTGIATAMVGAAKGYKVIIVMPEGMSEERKKAIRAYGAELVFTPGAESDVDLVVQKVQEIKASAPDRFWEVGQFTNRDNVTAHYMTTGPEIWEQTEGRIDIFVASQGTGGTLTGTALFLKEQNPRIKVFAVEPAECPILSAGRWGSHRIEGIGDGFVPDNLDIELLDGVVTTTSDESIQMARRLAREEGIFCGISSGCNVAAAIKVANRFPEAQLIVTMINDHGFRYFSTELAGEVKHLEVPEREHPLPEDQVRRLESLRSRWVIIE